MCQLHEIRATYSECKMLGESSSLSFLKTYNPFSNSQPHLLIRQDIYLCGDASKDKSKPTCGTMNSFMSDDIVAEVGASRVMGKCPVCEAAERAVQETSVQIVYVSYPTFKDRTGS